MQKLLKLEQVGQLMLAIFLYQQLHTSWWLFLGLFFLPDLSMLGYGINPKIGAYVYNFFHSKFVAIFCLLIGFYAEWQPLYITGIILFGHASFDRILGYGLKYADAFAHTHLGFIGKNHKK
ncbi:DUF4260 domain-containing protein [Flavobacterium agricola]|uniref:DUF4260 domain-containing protein n=1 Tax=Flavobacterium agricola TaxID=2870839 RepID=A0ABY6M065_9FLAO|nr:DUF4260 domain-containing protein [Flavobacterium agricola]UYW01939.1 DUF4260 domain-containing protein [Flavobacterium agricola]